METNVQSQVTNELSTDDFSAGGLVTDSKAVSRRRLLAAGVAAAIGTIASAVLPRKAQGDDGGSLTIGQANTGSSQTSLETAVGPSSEESATLRVRNTRFEPLSWGLLAQGYDAVWGESYGTKTVRNAPYPVGVQGAYNAPAAPASGEAFGIGVAGSVWSETRGAGGEPVSSNKGVGVFGSSGEYLALNGPGEPPFEAEQVEGTGVIGVGSRRGVWAESTSGTALLVRGKASFSRSGRGLIRAGRNYATVSCAGLAWNSMILVTLQGSAGPGRYVAYASRTSASAFRVALNAAATRNAYFAWFVIN